MGSNDERRTGADAFAGTWRITHMDMWDQDAVDLLGPASSSSTRIEAVACASSPSRPTWTAATVRRRGKPFVEFSFSGQSEHDPISGRGCAAVKGDAMEGTIYLHLADQSEFTAERQELGPDALHPKQPYPRRRRRW